MTFHILVFQFPILGIWPLVCVCACAGSWACAWACAWACVGVGVCACRCGRGRAYGGGRACLRFKRVLRRPVGEPGGGFQGSLFAGSVTIAERGQTAFNGPLCTLWVRMGKGVRRGAKGRDRGVKTRKGAPFRRRPYSASRLVVWVWLSRLTSRNLTLLLLVPDSVSRTP